MYFVYPSEIAAMEKTYSVAGSNPRIEVVVTFPTVMLLILLRNCGWNQRILYPVTVMTSKTEARGGDHTKSTLRAPMLVTASV